MISRKGRQLGVILPMMAILIVVLLGMVGLALDYGRMTLWENRLQNAVDGAALAAAAELDGREGALDRAEAAAREMLEPDEIDLEVEIDDITFYETIGSSNDPAGSTKVTTDSAYKAHYVQVEITEWPIQLFFIPVLNALPGDPVAEQKELDVRALAGRHFFVCNYPPTMMCNPFEESGETGKSLRKAVDDGDLEQGDMLILKHQSKTWAPGNFAFLFPQDEQGNFYGQNKKLGQYIADPSNQVCTPPTVRTEPGNRQSFPTWGWNTRFDLYQHNTFEPGEEVPPEYPAAPNVIEYPRDETFRTIGGLSDRFGKGDWPRAEYWNRYHASHDPPWSDAGDSDMTRWEVYNYELNNGYFPCDPNGPDGEAGTGDDITCPDQVNPYSYDDPAPTPEPPDDVLDGLADPTHLDLDSDSEPPWVPERRVIFVASVDCNEQNVSGRSDAVAETFAKFFILQRAQQGAKGKSHIDFVVEFMGLASEQDEDYHVEVQLYE